MNLMKLLLAILFFSILPTSAFGQAELKYCQAWVADTAHIRPSATLDAGNYQTYQVDCPTWIQFEKENCDGSFISGGTRGVDGRKLPCSIPTDTELLAAKLEIKAEAARKADVARAREQQAKAWDEEDAARKRAANNAGQALLARLSLHLGQSQSTVKAELQAKGFKMPWICGGQLLDGEWIAGCNAYRGQEKITVLFSVYRLARYINPDTQETSTVKEKTDRLFKVVFEDDNGKEISTLN